MKYQYRITPLAVSDIDESLDYISSILLNKKAADSLFASIKQEISVICENPFSFPDCSYYLIEDKTIRHSVVGNYVLIFEVCEKEGLIKILRFIYGRMNIPSMSISTN